MSELEELNAAVRKLNDLWLVCPPEQREEVLTKRDELDAQAVKLANLTLKEGTEELNNAMKALKELTETATKAKEEIDKVGKSINKVADTINKAVVAVAKVAELIAKLKP